MLMSSDRVPDPKVLDLVRRELNLADDAAPSLRMGCDPRPASDYPAHGE